MEANVQQAVPFFRVADMAVSVAFYVDRLGFAMTNSWIEDGVLRWCRLEHGKAALMLQGPRRDPGATKVGEGVSISFTCNDALAIYRDAVARQVDASRPFVGNAMWVTIIRDPDGYVLEFQSPTDVPEETELAQ